MKNLRIFEYDLIELVKVGEESGYLDLMLNSASALYFEKLTQLLTFLLNAIQPILMIILGFFIALLIFAVYLPIFNLPNIVQN